MSTHSETYTKEKFTKKMAGFGTLTFTYDIKTDKTPEEITTSYTSDLKQSKNSTNTPQKTLSNSARLSINSTSMTNGIPLKTLRKTWTYLKIKNRLPEVAEFGLNMLTAIFHSYKRMNVVKSIDLIPYNFYSAIFGGKPEKSLL